MCLTEALQLPLATFSNPDLWEALRTIGAFKLNMRRRMTRKRLSNGVTDFAAHNKRIDELLVEHESRRKPKATAEAR